MDYLDCLNEPQREGVINTDGPTMIIAGAGSGKTRVLTYRIAHLIKSRNIDPFTILALTFTNKAAQEMRHRIESVVGNEARNIWMGTFHSVFAKILRIEAHRIGYPSNFTIYDTDDSKSLIKSIVKELQLDDKLYKANIVYNRISGAKNRLVSWQEYNNNPIYQADDIESLRPEIGRIYKIYAERCFKATAMDFDDLLFNTHLLFKTHTDILNKYQHRFHYVLVDEFQDTNIVQYLIVKMLSSVKENICVVGDDAQSIYAFRGANIQNILNFEKHFPDLKVIKLEQNYRSTKTIVNAANSVILKNSAQLRKNVWTSNEDGELVELIKSNSDSEEGKLVASSIFEERVNRMVRNNEVAVLYRTNSQSRSIEDALRRMNIKYKIIGGLSFYQRKEIKDLLAYLRYALNTNDEQSLRRIINLPKRGIGDATVDKVLVGANEQGISIWEAVTNAQYFVGGRAANAISDFVVLIKSFQMELERKDAYEAANEIAKRSGLLKELYEDKTVEGLNRYENVQELLNAIKEFVDSPDIEDRSLSAYLQEISLLTGIDSTKDEEGDDEKVTLMTIHMAKGLEFRHVYVVGMEEDLFPSQMMLTSRADLEEERRLFYVAITRAKEKLFLSYANTRYRFGRLKTCEPSRFLEEIDPAFIKLNKKWVNQLKSPTPTETSYPRNLFQKAAMKPVVQKPYVPSPDFVASDTSGLAAGMKVEHPKFGFGTVIRMDLEGANRKAMVNFDNFGEKTLLLTFAKLRILLNG
jgi:DNA helicase II / ATP-dependent DNA helicase PcrA